MRVFFQRRTGQRPSPGWRVTPKMVGYSSQVLFHDAAALTRTAPKSPQPRRHLSAPTVMNTQRCLLAFLANLAALGMGAQADPPEVAALLQHPILDAGLPLAEVEAYTEARVPAMPPVKTLPEWEQFATQTRRDVLDKIVFRGETARQWRDARTKVEWLETIEGGPGYHLKKVRYEVLPGMWTVALLYEPDAISGKIPVHLAVNGHDYANGKAAGYKQLRCINLAKRGVATLNVDWLGTGQLHTDDFAHARMNQLDLCGVSGLAPFYLEMSRGLDLLLSLPYADEKRVAVSGLSGGGWQTITISSLDTRVTLCNPVAGYSSFRTRSRFPSDLGDSEQTPNDLATVADYTHLTAMLAGRAALLTFNAKDDCCFASDHALQPLLDAAEPIFRLYGQPERLRSHVNYDPGTHNYEVDNRQAFYQVIGEEFFPGMKAYDAQEIPSANEVKTPAQLEIALPADNHGFHQLAIAASKDLPRDSHLAEGDPAAALARLADIVKYQAHTVAAERAGAETRGDVQATFWKLRVGDRWTVPAVELVRGTPAGTVLLVADQGRKGAAGEVERLLGEHQRVIALDPFGIGESKIAQRDYLHALAVAAVGDRPLGIEASEMAAVARWARAQFKDGTLTLQAMGPRLGTSALVAVALEHQAIGRLKLSGPLHSLHEIVDGNWTVDQKPELFCFGLLEAFDIPQLKQMCGVPVDVLP